MNDGNAPTDPTLRELLKQAGAEQDSAKRTQLFDQIMDAFSRGLNLDDRPGDSGVPS